MTTSPAPSMPLLLAAAHQHSVPRPPVWFMRQAGRSLPEYRALRATSTMMTACRTPELVAEITMQPVRRHQVDAAIFFSDIVVPMHAAGIDVDIVPGVGPVIANPVRTADDVAKLRELTPDDLSYITQAVRLTVAELGETPLIGFAGAPFTLASYLVEGGPSKTLINTKALMYGAPEVWNQLCTVLAQWSATFLRTQIAAGAQMVQLFDSWVGALPATHYRHFVQAHSRAVFDAVADTGAPRIHFGVATGELLADMADVGTSVIGIDYRVNLKDGARRAGGHLAVQGNLDPAVLAAPWTVVEREVRRIVGEGRECPGHIFNLGHGVLPETDPGVLTKVVDLVKALGEE